MVSVMAIGSEVFGECVEAIRIEVVGKMLGIVLVCLEFLVGCIWSSDGSVVRFC